MGKDFVVLEARIYTYQFYKGLYGWVYVASKWKWGFAMQIWTEPLGLRFHVLHSNSIAKVLKFGQPNTTEPDFPIICCKAI